MPTVVRSRSGRPASRIAAAAPVTDLSQLLGPPDEGDPGVAQVEQMLSGEATAEDVVDVDRAGAAFVTAAVDHDDGGPPGDQAGHTGFGPVDGSDEHPLHAQLLEAVQVGRLPLDALVGVADEQRQPGLFDHLLHAPGHVGEERVGRVEHDVGDDVALTRPQLPR